MPRASVSQLARDAMGKVLPYSLYLAAARAYGRAVSRRMIGYRSYRRLQQVARDTESKAAVAFEAPGISHPMYVRPGTSDALVFEGNILRQTYNCIAPKNDPRLIIDAGVNVGYASAYLLEKFPNAHVIGLEPDSGNIEAARKNLAPYQERVELLQKGLWSRPAKLRVRLAERADGIQVFESDDDDAFDCEGIDVFSLLEMTPESRISILKIDIEGAEQYVFEADCDVWLERTDWIAIEIHNQPSYDAVYRATARHGFKTFRNRELHVFHL